MRLKIPGVAGYVIRSLKTTDLSAAAAEAEDLFYALRAEQKQGLDVRAAGNLVFKNLWRRFYEVHRTGLSIHRQRLHTLIGNKYFIPYFGEHRVADMPDAFVEQYWDWRINFHNPERWEAEGIETPMPPNAVRIPSQKTLDMEAGMLRQIFRWGKRVGSVKREPWAKAPRVKHTKGVERRPSIEEAEWRQVYEYLREWVKEPLETGEGRHGAPCTAPAPMRSIASSGSFSETTSSLWLTAGFVPTKLASFYGRTFGSRRTKTARAPWSSGWRRRPRPAPGPWCAARAPSSTAKAECVVLGENLEGANNKVSVSIMHLAKGLEFRGVAVMACDDEVLPLQQRIEEVSDESDLEEAYNTERHLLYVACTRARDRLFVSGVTPASEFLADLNDSEYAGQSNRPKRNADAHR